MSHRASEAPIAQPMLCDGVRNVDTAPTTFGSCRRGRGEGFDGFVGEGEVVGDCAGVVAVGGVVGVGVVGAEDVGPVVSARVWRAVLVEATSVAEAQPASVSAAVRATSSRRPCTVTLTSDLRR